MEIFNHSFYRNLDDTILCGDMADNDFIVCFELPCNSQQNRAGSPYKPGSKDPFILPLFLSDAPSRNAINAHPTVRLVRHHTVTLFGYPSVVVIDREQATSMEAMYEAVVERLQRWTTHAKELYSWELGSKLGSRPRSSASAESMEEVPIQITGFPPIESITEIKENGDVVTVDVTPPLEEGDITDEKRVDTSQAEGEGEVIANGVAEHGVDDDEPRKLHAKPDLFELRLQANNKEMGRGLYGYGFTTARYESWEIRQAMADSNPVLLREGDALVCQFDEHMKALFFGDERSRYAHARWEIWEEFTHPEYARSQKTSAALQSRGITLQDCLEEFTKEEQLGEDDLWYCPRCKKHQQATKKFDLWKAPDVLVVHLKRFSNSRILRDKIDAFVDFPIRDLDLTEMVGERKVAKKLLAEGVDIEALGLNSLEEDLIYDLYAVDEHLGGLGGGHYRAYSLNHLNGKWYHFDDSFVSDARPSEAVVSPH
jgi:ubiquitin carboxyl-terminal hydrolase 4/11/15